MSDNNGVVKYKGRFSIARLVISIVSFVICVIVLIQSCATGFVNALEESKDVSGSAGFILTIFILVGAIVGIVTRNSRSKAGPIVAGAFYLLGGLLALLFAGGTYGDLIIWAVISIVFGIFFIVAGVLNKSEGN